LQVVTSPSFDFENAAICSYFSTSPGVGYMTALNYFFNAVTASRGRAGAALLALSLVTGCATPANPRDDAEFQSYASTVNRPVLRPVRSVSNFSGALMCMDALLREAQIPTTLIASKQIPDASTRVPVAAKDMIITALSQMSRLSNAFRYVDYEVDIAR
jgi:hypothetical protein